MEALGPRPDGETENAIAVVGMACRFPGDADNIENFWEMIRDGRDAWSEIPSDRFNAKGWYHPDPNRPGSFHIRGAHFIKGDIAAFDAPFFSISTAEAVSMDPQQRMLLEVVYEALDSAGIPMASLSNSATSVYCGSFVRDYEQPCMRDPDTTPPYSATGNGIAILANRISHAFDFAGTSQTIDTGCSASMIAVHQACKSLLSGESNIGIAAGVGLIFSPNTLVPMANLNILGSDGRCYTFDERANGYGRGEGAGVIVLKRLKDAIASNDTIRAVIRATASNQDGHTQGITLPSQARQVQNMSDIYRKSGLDITRTAYMECHGTGTQVGDVKETQAATELFCKHRTTENPLIIGSVKTNIGHLEGSAGVAGLIKGILTVERGFIPKHLNFKSPNKQIDFDRMKLKVG
ncbi:hypothetical protein SEUCBS139899_009678 [Sporothrix eucalyptigena]|uniref:Ketosynthase family 3 (KS3) domain-containing protein n=1 Tax=Sporothrix eucalyptigena TaxID=1812306 RepID=A0ABP0CYB2_9PEZI